MSIDECSSKILNPGGSVSNEVATEVFRVLRVGWITQSAGEAGRLVWLGNSFKTVQAFLPATACTPWLQMEQAYRLRLVAGAEGTTEGSGVRIDPASIVLEAMPNPLYLIPAAWTPEPAMVGRLIGLYQGLENQGLRKFWEAVFSDTVWLQRFLAQPASRCCHHTTPGGLLAHSVSVATMVEQMLAPLPNLTRLEADAAVTVALLHDAAKVVLVPDYPNRWELPFNYREHERYLPFLVADALSALKQRDSQAWATLTRLLDDYCRPGQRPNNPLGNIVRNADQLDAHLDARRSERDKVGNHRNMVSPCGNQHTWIPT